MGSVRLEQRPDGVAVVVLDTPGSTVNVLSRALLHELAGALDAVEADPAVRGCVLASGKPGTFIAGADLDEVEAFATPEDGEAFSRDGHALLNRIAGSPKPFVAAVAGPALGGGLEAALACRARVAVDAPQTVLALPEVTLGLLPGGGGTQRLPRLIGLPRALPLLLAGKRVRPRAALAAGLVDRLVDGEAEVVEAAAREALALAGPRGRARRRRPDWRAWLAATAPGRAVVLRRARREVRRRTGDHLPAPACILECVETGYERGFVAGIEKESIHFGRLAAGPEAKCLLGLFRASRELKRPRGDDRARRVERLAVVGGGLMGRGIAAVSVPLVPVVVTDVSRDARERVVVEVRTALDRRLAGEAITPGERDRFAGRLRVAEDVGEVAGADLVIEAVFEDLELKRSVLAEVERHVAPETVVATNTSALPIASVADGARHPERILGMHYFSPVSRMALLELVVGERTAAWAADTARAFAIRQGKTVVAVADGPGFYTTRILAPLLSEAVTLVEEGARVEDVDRAVTGFGFPMGPLALLDEIGLDVAAHVTRDLGERFAGRGFARGGGLVRLLDEGCRGRKNRKGFYLYDGRRRRRPVHERVYAILGGGERRADAARDAARRCVAAMVNEAIHCLDRGVVSGPRDGDVAAVLGVGFPAFRGGPFRHVDTHGPAEILDELERLRDAHGIRFDPAPGVRDLVRRGARFHP